MLPSSQPLTEFRFDPPLLLEGDVSVTTLAEAAAYARSLTKVRMSRTRDSVLRWLERATANDPQHKAAEMFRVWAQSEGMLPRSK
jgi:hypothetical protein